MARLIVVACSAESFFEIEGEYFLTADVSVSRADDGKPVTGLKAENFRVSARSGWVKDYKVGWVNEWNWEPADVEPAGCYQVRIDMVPDEKFVKGERYVFGIQARTFGRAPLLPHIDTPLPRPVIDQGQTVFELIHTGAF